MWEKQKLVKFCFIFKWILILNCALLSSLLLLLQRVHHHHCHQQSSFTKSSRLISVSLLYSSEYATVCPACALLFPGCNIKSASATWVQVQHKACSFCGLMWMQSHQQTFRGCVCTLLWSPVMANCKNSAHESFVMPFLLSAFVSELQVQCVWMHC